MKIKCFIVKEFGSRNEFEDEFVMIESFDIEDVKDVLDWLEMCNEDSIEEEFEDNSRARLAHDVFCYRLKKYIGAYVAALSGLDAVVFTGLLTAADKAIALRALGELERAMLLELSDPRTPQELAERLDIASDKVYPALRKLEAHPAAGEENIAGKGQVVIGIIDEV